MVQVLIVGDDPAKAAVLREGLSAQGYGVVCARTAAIGSHLSQRIDLAILALRPAAASASEISAMLNGIDASVPVVLLTGREGERPERAVGMAKAAVANGRHEFGDVVVDFERCSVARNGTQIELSSRELALLRYLVERRGSVVTRDELLHDVWGSHEATLTRTIDMHVAKLRRKLGDSSKKSRYILTVHRSGYQFIA